MPIRHLLKFAFIWPCFLTANAQEFTTIKAVAPSSYPPIAKIAKLTGKVEVGINIGTDGRVSSILYSKLLEGKPQLIANAEYNAKLWEFSPGKGGEYFVIFEYRLTEQSDNNIDTTKTTTTEFISPNHIIITDKFIKLPPPEPGRRIVFTKEEWKKYQREQTEYSSFSADVAGKALFARIIKDRLFKSINPESLLIELDSEQPDRYYFKVSRMPQSSDKTKSPELLRIFAVRRPNSFIWWDPKDTKSLQKDSSYKTSNN